MRAQEFHSCGERINSGHQTREHVLSCPAQVLRTAHSRMAEDLNAGLGQDLSFTLLGRREITFPSAQASEREP